MISQVQFTSVQLGFLNDRKFFVFYFKRMVQGLDWVTDRIRAKCLAGGDRCIQIDLVNILRPYGWLLVEILNGLIVLNYHTKILH